jgi:hypothetical protein
MILTLVRRLLSCVSAAARSFQASRLRRRVIAMRFLMLVCRDSVPVQAPAAPAGQAVEQWVTMMDDTAVRVAGGELAPDAEAVAVRVRDGQRQVTDSAFLETKGALLGFDLLECQDMAEAIDVVAAHPLASRCVLEIRPVVA